MKFKFIVLLSFLILNVCSCSNVRTATYPDFSVTTTTNDTPQPKEDGPSSQTSSKNQEDVLEYEIGEWKSNYIEENGHKHYQLYTEIINKSTTTMEYWFNLNIENKDINDNYTVVTFPYKLNCNEKGYIYMYSQHSNSDKYTNANINLSVIGYNKHTKDSSKISPSNIEYLNNKIKVNFDQDLKHVQTGKLFSLCFSNDKLITIFEDYNKYKKDYYLSSGFPNLINTDKYKYETYYIE